MLTDRVNCTQWVILKEEEAMRVEGTCVCVWGGVRKNGKGVRVGVDMVKTYCIKYIAF